jgi:hypothetical protein
MIVIYLIEGREPFCISIKKALEAAERISFSTFGLGEVLAGFEKAKDKQGKIKFLSFIESYKKLSVIGYGKQEALIFAELRAKYPSAGLRRCSLAAAVSAGGWVLTIKSVKVEEVPVLMPDLIVSQTLCAAKRSLAPLRMLEGSLLRCYTDNKKTRGRL